LLVGKEDGAGPAGEYEKSVKKSQRAKLTLQFEG